jgi:hypothetical protein
LIEPLTDQLACTTGMSFAERRARKKQHRQMAKAGVARRWLDWRRTHADTLSLLRIPDVYLKCEDYWHDFLQHGRLHYCADSDEDDTARANDVSSLSVEQARAFFELIHDEYPDGWSNVDHVIYRVYEIIKRAD